MDVSVIIVNYNTKELTKNTIYSVIEKTKELNYEIILVDNNSIDGSVEFLEKKYKNKVIFIKNEKNLGFGKANNKGIKIAKGKYVFLLNSDTLLLNNAIKILFDYMEKNENCGICGGNLYDENLNPTHSFAKNMPSNKIEINYLKFLYEKIRRKREDFNYNLIPSNVGYITGADMMIRKSILNEVGIFDEDFFMYFEEVELTHRIKKNNYTVISVPQAKIVHLEGKSSNFKEQKMRMFLESKYKYFSKTHSMQICKKIYFLSQIKYFFILILTINFNYLKLIKINKEEYNKFLLYTKRG